MKSKTKNDMKKCIIMLALLMITSFATSQDTNRLRVNKENIEIAIKKKKEVEKRLSLISDETEKKVVIEELTDITNEVVVSISVYKALRKPFLDKLYEKESEKERIEAEIKELEKRLNSIDRDIERTQEVLKNYPDY